MAIQDDIMALLSQVPAGGDRATARQNRGIELYENIGSLIGDSPNYRKALRELTGLGSREDMTLEEEMRNDAGLSDRVASIIEKYMEDAATIGQVPADMIVDDTREAERMLETVGMAPREAVSIEELPAAAPRQAVTRKPLPPIPDFDEAALESMGRNMTDIERDIRQRDEGLAGLMAGQMEPLRASDIEPMAEYRPGQANAMRAMRDMSQSPSTRRPEGMTEAQNEAFTRMIKSQLANEVFPRTGMTPEDTYDLFMSGDAEAEGRMVDRMSGPSGREYTERRGRLVEGDRENQALALGAIASAPVAALPSLAAQVGIRTAQVARFLRGGRQGEQALREAIKKRVYARDAQGRFVSPNSTPGARMTERVTPGKGPGLRMGESQLRDMGLFGRLAGGAAGGGSVGNIRDKIMKTYGGM